MFPHKNLAMGGSRVTFSPKHTLAYIFYQNRRVPPDFLAIFVASKCCGPHCFTFFMPKTQIVRCSKHSWRAKSQWKLLKVDFPYRSDNGLFTKYWRFDILSSNCTVKLRSLENESVPFFVTSLLWKIKTIFFLFDTCIHLTNTHQLQHLNNI